MTAIIPGSGCLVLALIIFAACRPNQEPEPTEPTPERSISIPREQRCATCFLTLDLVTTFGSHSDPLLLDDRDSGIGVARSGDGRYYATAFGRRQIAIFDSLGKFSGALGRQGQGPGEFSGSISEYHVQPQDSVFVVQRRRVSVFSPTHVYVRGFNLLPSYGFSNGVLLRNSHYLYAAPSAVRREVSAERSLHLLSGSGELLQSLGSLQSYAGLGLAPTSTGVWVSGHIPYITERRSYDYRVEWRSYDGTRGTVVDVGNAARAPEVIRVGVWQEVPAGHLWVRLQVQAENPVPLPRPSPGIYIRGHPELHSEDLPSAEDMHRAFDTIIDILDINSGELIVSQRFDLVLYPVNNSDLLYSQHVDEYGVTSVKIWRIIKVEG